MAAGVPRYAAHKSEKTKKICEKSPTVEKMRGFWQHAISSCVKIKHQKYHLITAIHQRSGKRLAGKRKAM